MEPVEKLGRCALHLYPWRGCNLPETLMMSFSSSGLRRSLAMGGGGRGLLAIGTHPMAAARAKGNQAATDAMLPTLPLLPWTPAPPLATKTLGSPLTWGAILIAAGRWETKGWGPQHRPRTKDESRWTPNCRSSSFLATRPVNRFWRPRRGWRTTAPTWIPSGGM